MTNIKFNIPGGRVRNLITRTLFMVGLFSPTLFAQWEANESLAGTSQQGGFDYQWSNYTSDAIGTLPGNLGFDVSDARSIVHAPAPGVHPRIYINHEEIPELKERLANTKSGQQIMATIHAYLVLFHKSRSGYDVNASYAVDANGIPYISAIGYNDKHDDYYKLVNGDTTGLQSSHPNFVAGFMAMEAFFCYLYKDQQDPDTDMSYNDRAAMLTKAMVTWATARDNDNLTSENFRDLGVPHMALTYDFHFHALNEEERTLMRRVLARTVPEIPRYGDGTAPYASTSNWVAANTFELLPNLAIEGEPGYNPDLTRRWAKTYYKYITYGFYPSGSPWEAMGKGLMATSFIMPLAKRGYSLLGHPNVRGTKHFLTRIMQPFGEAFTSYDVWGGSGANPVTGGYKVEPLDPMGLKYAYPEDPTIDFLWQNYVGKDTSGSIEPLYSNDNGFYSGHNYRDIMIMAAVYAEDFGSGDWESRARSAYNGELDYLAPQRGLVVLRSSFKKDALATQFHVRQNFGGHTHGDRNDFTLSGLGRIWVRKTYGGSPFQPTYFHSCILIDDMGIPFSLRDGKKARQPAKIINYHSGPVISQGAGDATYAYNWEWLWSPKSPGEEYTQAGWAPATETLRDFLWRPDVELPGRPAIEPHYDIPFYDYASWVDAGKLERIIKNRYNTVEKVIRIVGLVKGKHPFMLVIDEVKKDDQPHNYKWVAQVANDLTIESTTPGNGTYDVILKEPDATGNRRLLVRMLADDGYSGGTPAVKLEKLEYLDIVTGEPYTPNPNYDRFRLVAESNTIEPNFKVMLYPHEAGAPMPTTSWNGDKTILTVNIGGEENVIRIENRTLFSDSHTSANLREPLKAPGFGAQIHNGQWTVPTSCAGQTCNGNNSMFDLKGRFRFKVK